MLDESGACTRAPVVARPRRDYFPVPSLTYRRMRFAHGLIATRLTAHPLAALAPAALAAQGPSPPPAITFSGEVRARSEVARPDGPSSGDASTAVRSRLAARARLHDGVRLVV